jgi:hypothetical protein
MRRNGYTTQSGQECSSSSGLLTGLVSLVGGVGLGAGLLYLLDPDQGEKRRQRLMNNASGLASSAGGALGNVGGVVGNALSSARDYASDKWDDVRGYASDSADDARSYASKQARNASSGIRGFFGDRTDDARKFVQRQTFGETREEHRLGVTMCALGSMALGAAIMYALDPTMGSSRRRFAREKATELASGASDYARHASDAIRAGIDQAKDKVSNMTAGSGSDSTVGGGATQTNTGQQVPPSGYASTRINPTSM